VLAVILVSVGTFFHGVVQKNAKTQKDPPEILYQ
jgi:hypothetical protein